MIVGINARILAIQNTRGWSRYTYNLIHGLHKRGIGLRLFSDRPIEKRWVPSALHSQIYIKQGLNYVHWEQMVLSQMGDDHKIDILHCPINYGLPVRGKYKKVLTVHDAIEKSYYDQFKTMAEKFSLGHLKVRGLHLMSQKAADKIITVSEFAKQDIVSSYPVRPEKITVIYEAAENHFNKSHVRSQDELLAQFHLRQGYYFYVGGLEQRKNIPLLIEIAKRLESTNFHLVIAGGDPSALKKDAPKNITFLGYVDEEFLPTLYFYSKAFLYPSFQEGFGLQIVEALQMEKPVVYANSSSLPEIYGNDDYGFNPNSVDDAIAKIIHLDNTYAKAVNHARTRKLAFSWDKTIDQTIALYKSL